MRTIKDRVFGLDAMRAFCTLTVVFGHSSYNLLGYDNPITDLMQIVGVFGVEAFFVLSGFLIGVILLDLLDEGKFNFSTVKFFLIRRWFRTLPIYYLFLIINIILFYLFSYGLPDDLWSFFFFLQNFDSKQSLFFTESWSLTIEEYGYILACVLIYLISKVITKKSLVFLLVTFFIITFFLSFKVAYFLKHTNIDQSISYWNNNLKGVLIYRVDSFFYGFILAYFFKNKTTLFKTKRVLLFSLGILLLLVVYSFMFLTNFDVNNYSFFWNVLYLPLNSIGIMLCIPFMFYFEINKGLIKSLLKKISLYSYSIYLLHQILLLFLFKKFILIKQLNYIELSLYLLLYLITTYLLGSLVYRYFEKPIMDLRDKPFFNKR